MMTIMPRQQPKMAFDPADPAQGQQAIAQLLADQPAPAFVWGQGGQMLTPDTIARQRADAQEASRAGSDYSPVQSWSQGLARVANALAGKYEGARADEAEQAGRKSASDSLNAYETEESDPKTDPKSHLAHTLELADNPWLGNGARAVLLQSMKAKDPNGPFAGTGYDASSANILVQGQKDPAIRSSPQYALAWANQTQPRVVQDAQGRSVLYTPPPPQGILPPIYPQGEGSGAQSNGAPGTGGPGGGALPPRVGPGSTAMIPGLDSTKLTDDQAKALGFANRIQAANKILGSPDATAAEQSRWSRAASAVPIVGNYMAGEDYQQADQATRDFVNAVLRRESGAAISQSEFDNAYQQYIPQPGDGPKVLQQKADARRRAFDSMMASTTPSRSDAINALTGPNSAPQMPPPGAPAQEQFTPTSDPSDASTIGGAQPTTVPPPSPNAPPSGAIEMLRRDPSLAAKFDQKYGQGAASKVLGQ